MVERCLCTTFRQIAAESTAFYDEALAPAGIKVTAFRLLRRIEAAGEVSISGLADLVGLDRSTLGRNLKVLEKQSLIRMTAGKDARARIVTLTGTGLDRLGAALPLWRKAQEDYARLIGEDAKELLERMTCQTQDTKDAAGAIA